MSKYCKYCEVSLDDGYERCPLCHRYVGEAKGELPYPKNPLVPKAMDAVSKKGKIYIILTILACCVVCLINAVNWQGEFWCQIIVVPILYAMFVLGSIFTHWSKGASIFINMLGISGVLLVIESYVQKGLWAQEYVIPFVLMGAIALYIIYFFKHRKKLRESFFYCIIAVILGFVPLTINILLQRAIWWPSVACGIMSGITFIGIIFFAVKQFTNEMEKRFHI